MSIANAEDSIDRLQFGQGVDVPPERRVDYQNWTLAPYNRWSFQRVQQFTRTGRISRAACPSELPERPTNLENVSFADSIGEKVTVREMLARTWTDGFVVLHRGELLTEQYFNGMKPDTLHLMMSCSKSLTSTMVGIAVAEGHVDPGALLTDYIPELNHTGMDGATLQQALDMRVGVKFEEDYADLDGDWRQCEVATGWREPDAGYVGPRDMIGYMQTLRESDGPHGAEFHYRSILTDVIGICLERATGRTFLDLFEQAVWHPMGAEHDLVSIVDAAGTAVFEGGFNCCLRDLARFGRLIASDGNVGGLQLVPQDWIDGCRFPDAELIDAFALSEYGEVLTGHAYHNQWWIRNPERGVMMALGIHGQTLYIDPDQDFVVAKCSSQPLAADINMAVDQMLGFEAILGAL